ncbi:MULTISPECIES: response regulator transcription factor [Ralstonia]|jgi:two-component system response regulator QseB|uniref:Transcriptional regulatory protein QseB n=1 Tax=Ralstonia flaminis TaxID=3058597 RepID=A0ABM9KCQ1_9RALS|nr:MULTISPECIES: response regulator transcription factor [unclassified Ralstonia]CAJ0822231.1 Transcriptional regulatory protein QseB [Ralstonia sp. LMG 18101]
MRLLVVEDDPMIGEDLEEGLRQENYAVDWVRDGDAAALALRQQVYDLLLLDLGLPGRSGREVLKAYRDQGGDIPALIISARDTPADRVMTLDAGADDYLIKPFDFAELMARIRALLRRRSGRRSATIVYGGLSLNPGTHEALFCDQPLNLSKREFALLLVLMDARGEVVSRGLLKEKLYDWDADIESNTVEVYIHALRRKLGRDFIKNVRGVGYKLTQTP